MTEGRFIPYATIGAGVISNRGDLPTASLERNYSILEFGLFPFDKTDTVNLRHSIDDNVFAGVFGVVSSLTSTNARASAWMFACL